MSNQSLFRAGMVALALLIALAGATPLAAAQEEDCVDACLDDPTTGPPEVVPGGGVAFDTPVVDTEGVMPGDRVSLNGDFEAFLKAKKAFAGTDNPDL
ncbi:MAG: hypothetical protein ACQETI_11580 [Halobacteriota archaeon]